jgi:glycosyltransferase involved in cell wall biosynthesis
VTAAVRVACVIPEYPDPAHPDRGERLAFDLAGAMAAEAGIDLTVLTPARRGDTCEVTHGELRVRELAARCGGEPGDGASWALASELADADVVHIHELATRWGESALLAARVWRRPVCVTDHGFGTSSIGAAVGAAQLTSVALAPGTYGGVDTGFFAPPASDESRTALLVTGSAVRAAALGPLPAATDVVLATDLDGDDALRAAAQRSIAVLGPVGEDTVAFPRSMMAAMACGAIALTSAGAYVDDGEVGVTVAGLTQVADAVSRLVIDAGARAGLAARGRAACVARWDLAAAAARLANVYRDLGRR